MSNKSNATVATMGIDIGKNWFHVVGFDQRGAIVLRQKWSRGQVEARLANMLPCLIGMEACVGAHHLSRKLQSLGHDARLMPAKYVRPYASARRCGVTSHRQNRRQGARISHRSGTRRRHRRVWRGVETQQR
jgi:transposase